MKSEGTLKRTTYQQSDILIVFSRHFAREFADFKMAELPVLNYPTYFDKVLKRVCEFRNV